MLDLIPLGILGTLLFFAGIELLRNAVKTDHVFITGAMGIVTLIFDPTVGLVAGIFLYLAYLASSQIARGRRKEKNDGREDFC